MKLIIYIIYQCLLVLLSPLIVLFTIRDAKRRQGGWRFVKQRLGFGYTKNVQQPLWFHAASLGEVNAIAPLIQLIHQQHPELALLITSNTASGAAAVKKLPHVEHAYLPVDWPWSVWHFLRCYQPQRLVIVETELWPNLYRQASKLSRKPVIINGRLSEKTSKHRWAHYLFALCFEHVEKIYTRSDKDTDLFRHLGAETNRVSTVGNIKFSGDIPNADKLPRLVERDYILAASTHHDEEYQFCKTLQSIDQLFVIIPRHPERLAAILESLKELSLNIAVRSRGDKVSNDTHIYMADTIGEMMNFMAHAELVFMGGSLIPHGGQNMLEAARLGKAIIMGPHVHNFANEVAVFEEIHALEIVNDANALSQRIKQLFESPEQLEIMGQRAKELMSRHTNIADKYFTLLDIK